MMNPEKLFDFICRYSDDNRGLTPSVTEICEEMGWSSKAIAARYLDDIQSRGWIRRHRWGDGCPNNIEIVMEPKPKGELVAHCLRESDFPLMAALSCMASIDAAVQPTEQARA
jgi:SOS-response transcriptional repressor LexA